MTLLFCDGFDTGDFANKWGGLTLGGTGVAPTASTTTPYSAGKSLATGVQPAGTAQLARLSQAIPSLGTVYFGFAFSVLTRPASSDNPIIRLMGDGGTTEHVRLTLPVSGPIVLGRATTALGALTLSPVLTQWYYLEFRVTLSDTVGEIVCRIDGNADTSLTNVDTKNGGTGTVFDSINIGIQSGSSGVSGSILYDDFYICDTAGTRNNTFIGPIRIQTLSPNAAGADTGLTPLSGSNYQNVSDQNAATYNYSATIGARDTYALPDLVVGTTSVLAVRNVVAGQNSDAGAGGFKPVVRSGGTVYYDPVTVGATNRVYSQAVRETDPATSAAWTVPNVNALQVGAEVS
jgi:hypothetical protein